MADPINQAVFERVVKDVEGMELRVIAAKDLRLALDQVGEDTTELRQLIKDIEQRVARWKKMLTDRGFM